MCLAKSPLLISHTNLYLFLFSFTFFSRAKHAHNEAGKVRVLLQKKKNLRHQCATCVQNGSKGRVKQEWGKK